MADNPFEDPDVQAAAASDGGPPPAPKQVYGQDNAYGDANQGDARIDVGMGAAVAAAQYIPAEQQKQIAVSAGSAIANSAADKAKADYNQSQSTQQDQHQAPEPPSFCVNLFNWFPLRIFAFVAGAFLIAGPILDIAFSTPSFIQFFIYLYLIGFGIVVMFVEAPTWTCTRFFQLKFFFWFRLLSRMWGRAWFYLFVSILCYAGVGSTDDGGGGSVFTVVAGIYLSIISILSFIFSRMAATKFTRIREYISAGAEGDELDGRFMRKFDELDTGGQAGTIGSQEIVKAAQQAGRVLSNSERHAVQTFLDEGCHGFVCKEDWMKQFVSQYQEKGYKQKFL
eukprot:76091_1